MLFRKLAVAVCLLFVSPSPFVQAGTTVAVLITFFVGHVRFQPYGFHHHNLVDGACTTAVELVLMAGVMFQVRVFVV